MCSCGVNVVMCVRRAWMHTQSGRSFMVVDSLDHSTLPQFWAVEVNTSLGIR